jgi:hypothetical protein
MKIEGKNISDYVKFSKYHIAILIIWTLLNFTLSKALFGTLMTKIAPIFLIIVFAHLGYKMRAKRFTSNGTLFNGLFIGFITGFLAGALSIDVLAYEFALFTKVGGWAVGQGTAGLVIGIISFGIIIGILRAILGGIIANIAYSFAKK